MLSNFVIYYEWETESYVYMKVKAKKIYFQFVSCILWEINTSYYVQYHYHIHFAASFLLFELEKVGKQINTYID